MMKALFTFFVAILLTSNVVAQEFGTRGIPLPCNSTANTCTFSIELFKGTAVSWYIVSQTSNTPGMKITSASTGQLLVDTKVFSRDLSNRSTGDFIVPEYGMYTVVFSNINQARFQQATITAGTDIASQVYQFAGEDGSDNDFNDIYAAITWYKRKG